MKISNLYSLDIVYLYHGTSDKTWAMSSPISETSLFLASTIENATAYATEEADRDYNEDGSKIAIPIVIRFELETLLTLPVTFYPDEAVLRNKSDTYSWVDSIKEYGSCSIYPFLEGYKKYGTLFKVQY